MSTTSRRTFLKTTTGAAVYAGALGFSARSYSAIRGANERVRVGVIGYADRFRSSLQPSFLEHAKELNFDLVAVSDIWSKQRDRAKAEMEKLTGHPIAVHRNNDEFYEKSGDVDAVFVATADFQHALHTVEAVTAGKDVYAEKPLAETMDDANAVLDAVTKSKRIVQVGSQRRSGASYQTAAEFVQSGKFGPIVNVELLWNVNQPGRWRRPAVVAELREEDTDWKRFLLNRPAVPFDARKHIEFRLFWPYSSGIPGQWMCHQIDTVHWFSGLPYPRSVAVNGGNYVWKDGRENADTLAAVFDYGSFTDPKQGFQVIFASRQTNSAGGTKEIYYSNGGTMNLDTNRITADGGLGADAAKAMGMQANLLAPVELKGPQAESAATTGADPLSSAHVRNWMECLRSRKTPHAPIEAGYHHSIAVIMTNAAYRTGERAVFDPKTRQVLAGGKPFTY